MTTRDTVEDLIEAPENVVREGGIDWYVTQLPDGHWIVIVWGDAVGSSVLG